MKRIVLLFAVQLIACSIYAQLSILCQKVVQPTDVWCTGFIQVAYSAQNGISVQARLYQVNSTQTYPTTFLRLSCPGSSTLRNGYTSEWLLPGSYRFEFWIQGNGIPFRKEWENTFVISNPPSDTCNRTCPPPVLYPSCSCLVGQNKTLEVYIDSAHTRTETKDCCPDGLGLQIAKDYYTGELKIDPAPAGSGCDGSVSFSFCDGSFPYYYEARPKEVEVYLKDLTTGENFGLTSSYRYGDEIQLSMRPQHSYQIIAKRLTTGFQDLTTFTMPQSSARCNRTIEPYTSVSEVDYGCLGEIGFNLGIKDDFKADCPDSINLRIWGNGFADTCTDCINGGSFYVPGNIDYTIEGTYTASGVTCALDPVSVAKFTQREPCSSFTADAWVSQAISTPDGNDGIITLNMSGICDTSKWFIKVYKHERGQRILIRTLLSPVGNVDIPNLSAGTYFVNLFDSTLGCTKNLDAVLLEDAPCVGYNNQPFAKTVDNAIQDTTTREFHGKMASDKIEGASFVKERIGSNFPAWVRFDKSEQKLLTSFLPWLKKVAKANEDVGFKLLKKETDELGMEHYRYIQIYKGIPIENAIYLVHVKNGKVISFNGFAVNIDKIYSVIPSVSKTAALEVAKEYIGAKKYKWEDEYWENNLKERKKNKDATYFPKGELCWYKNDLRNPGKSKNFRLAYKFEIYSAIPDKTQKIYVDAISGVVLNMLSLESECELTPLNTIFNGNKNIYTEKNGNSYRLKDVCQQAEIHVKDFNSIYGDLIYWSKEIENNTNIWSNDNERFGGTVLWGIKQAYFYFDSTFSRRSYDGDNGDVDAYINAVFVSPSGKLYTDNASMGNNGTMRIGLGSDGILYNSFATLDIIGHEYAHAVTGNTAQLEYRGESGALNESFSDIFGEAIERFTKKRNNDWVIGADRIDLYLRSLSRPEDKGQPDTYGTDIWWKNPFDDSWEKDYGGVHTNSGVQNFWFYLLVNGSNGTRGQNDNNDNYHVDGIGFDDAIKIAYRNLTFYLQPNSNYFDAREGAIQAAIDLSEKDACSNKVKQVTNAWYAVGVGQPFLSISAVPVANVSCSSGCDGIASAFVEGGSGTLGYLWDDPNAQTTEDAIGLCSGEYNVTVTDGSGCTATTSVFVIDNNCGGPSQTWYLDADGDGYYSLTREACCTPGTGWATFMPANGGCDCNDSDSSVHSSRGYYIDDDHDGYGSTAIEILCESKPPYGYSENNTDCDDTDGSVHELQTWYLDADDDGYYVSTTSSCKSPGTDWNSSGETEGDCNDNDAGVHVPVEYYLDDDDDGYGTSDAEMFCVSNPPSGYSIFNTDCDDTDPFVHPAAVETCNGKDDDCNSIIDDVDLLPAYAGEDQTVCYSNIVSISLTANELPAASTGHWEVVSGSGNFFPDASHSSVSVSNYSTGDNIYKWIYGCGEMTFSDEIVVHVLPPTSLTGLTVTSSKSGTVTYDGMLQVEICQGESVTLTRSGGEAGPNGFFHWYAGSCDNTQAGFSTEASVNVTPAFTTTYYIAAQSVCDRTPCLGVVQVVVHSGQTWFLDADNDGYYTDDGVIQCMSPGTGYKTEGLLGGNDCDDADATIHPAALEICNGIDDDCNGEVDEGFPAITYYRDGDSDGYGNPDESIFSRCNVPVGYVAGNNDCDDTNPDVHPGQSEVCNGIDDNCNGQIDEGVQLTFYRDTDHDGYGDPTQPIEACAATTEYVADNTDCDDTNPDVHPGQTEVCNGIDDNCNGQIDEGVQLTFYRDADHDGFGDPSHRIQGCLASVDYVVNNTDCDDNNPNVYPNAVEICDGLDNNCNGQIDESSSLVARVSSKVNPSSCANDGSITAGRTGGFAPFQYSLNGGAFQSGNIFTNLSAGSYIITVKDSKGCTASVTTTLTQTLFTATVSSKVNTSSCANDGSITASRTGGIAPFEYSLEGGAFQTSNQFTNLAAGSYIMTVKDSKGCTASVTTTLTQTVFTATISSKVNASSCANDGSITASRTGGFAPFEYSLDGGAFQTSNQFTNLGAGSYTITVKDSKGCTASVTTTLTQTVFTATVSSKVNTSSCANDGSITASRTGGFAPFEYSLDGGAFQTSNQFTNLAAGSYTITVKDSKGCTASVTTTLTQTVFTATISSKVNASSCANDGSITASRTGGFAPFEYSLDGGAFQSGNMFTNLSAGSYIITVKDGKGCTASVTTTLTQTVFTATISSKLNASSCANDGSITASRTGGFAPFEYSLDGGAFQTSNQFNNLSAGSYTITVKDSKGCTASVTTTLTQIVFTATISSKRNATGCNADGSITAGRSGGVSPFQYSINDGVFQTSNVFNNLAAGTYSITVKDSRGCTASVSSTITNSCTTIIANNPSGEGQPSLKLNGNKEYLKVRVFPNPSSTDFNLTIHSSTTEQVFVIVTDMYGKKVFESRGSIYQTYYFGEHFTSGTYIVQVIQGKKIQTLKVVKGG